MKSNYPERRKTPAYGVIIRIMADRQKKKNDEINDISYENPAGFENNAGDIGISSGESTAGKPQNKSLKDYKAIFILIVACLLIMAFIFYYRDVIGVINYYLGKLSAIIYGLFIAYLLNPIMNYFQIKLEKKYSSSKKEKVRQRAKIKAKRWAIAISVIIGVLIIAVLIMLIIPQVLKSVVALGSEAPGLITRITEKLDNWNSDRTWAGSFQKYIDAALDSIGDWITQTLVPKATYAVTLITSAAWSAFMFIVNFFIGIIIAVYT